MKTISKHLNIRNFILSFLSLYFSFDIITSLSNLIMGNVAEQELILSNISFIFKVFYIMQSFIESLVLSFVMTAIFKCKNSVISIIKGFTADEVINKLSSTTLKYEKQSEEHIIVYKNTLRRYYFGEIHLVLNGNEWTAIGTKPQFKKLQDLLQQKCS